MRPSYLGRILLRWCDQCHTPVLAKTCAACGAATREVPLTPPGDARPAFPADIALINSTFDEHFGAPLVPEGQLVLLNKVPDTDRMEEIVIGGGIAGSLRYIPEERRWEPIPRPEAYALFHPRKRFVVVDDSAAPFIRDQGMSVLRPGLAFIDDAICAGDEVFVLSESGGCIGAGRAKAGAEEARAMAKGPIVRNRRNVPSRIVPGEATWQDAVRSNAGAIAQAEAEAVRFVKDVAAAYPLRPTISYSGGKDSLATLLVVRKALGNVPLLFADTGLEFPDTYANVEAVQQKYGAEVIRTATSGKFFETLERQGPPAVNARWCCSVCKLLPVAETIRSTWGECLSFIGQRRYESLSRARSDRVWRNQTVKVQVSAAPIQDWTALHVWLYLFREEAPYNRLYEHRLDRIGCFMCPSSDMALIHMIETDFAGLWSGWKERLGAWQKKQGLPPDWIDSGAWRLKEGVHGKERHHH
ncbi:MAG: phosphoadenosine phosphosulfate reductase family protein [Methanoregula sp.]|uniref:phosphoadenosine phosphosulfate reductase domain-containing protein n=1 Tax=Methanoregula sp. TaxID=2052170 RepID=UPI003C311E3C